MLGVLKGQPPADGKVRLRADRTCNVDLLAGQTYAIFLYGDNVVWWRNEGTTRLWYVQDIDAKRLLVQLREQREEGVKRVKAVERCSSADPPSAGRTPRSAGGWLARRLVE